MLQEISSSPKPELNARNKVLLPNFLLVPIGINGFNVLNWNVSEVKKIDKKIRKLLNCHKMRHLKTDADINEAEA